LITSGVKVDSSKSSGIKRVNSLVLFCHSNYLKKEEEEEKKKRN